MAAKQTLPEQHLLLEQRWPGDCCLCHHEAENAALRTQLEQAQVELAASRRCVEAKDKALEEAEALGVDHAHGGVCETCNDWASRLADITGAALARTEADFVRAE